MKKIISSCLLFPLILLLSLPISAADTLTVDEAERLIWEVDGFYNYITNDIAREQPTKQYIVNGMVAVTDITTTTYEGLLSRAKKTFTESSGKRMISDTNCLLYENGNLHHVTAAPQFIPFSLDRSDMGFTFDLDVQVDTKGDTAVISFNYISIESPYPEFYKVARTNLTATFEDGECRVDGGEYMNMMYEFDYLGDDAREMIYNYFKVAPATGEGTIPLLCLAVASALLASCAKRRFARI